MSFEIPLTPASYTLSRGTPPSKLDLPIVVPLDEPPMNGITIQPPTAILQDSRPPPLDTTTNVWRPTLKGLSSAGSASSTSPGGQSPLSGLGSANISPSARHRLDRALSPDLPTRDCLYLFSNFSSYMRSPNEGPQGISGNEDFKDTVRLLDFARTLVAQPHSNVHILHVKYRFQSPTEARQSTYASGDRQLPVNWVDSMGRLRNPVPQPFSVARDPVLKIDYQENGVFTPLPAQAIFNHISRACYPPPRLIVASFVNSMVTQNHISQLATWALTSSPPCYILSPLETRVRILHPIQYTLHHAIPMSMYAQPDLDDATSPSHISPTHSAGGGPPSTKQLTDVDAKRRYSDNSIPNFEAGKKSLGGRTLTRDPIASLTIVSSPVPSVPGFQHLANPEVPKSASSCGTSTKGYLQSDRIPLWALAPGMNVLQGSTSASIGIKLSDFSALNLVSRGDDAPRTISSDAAPRPGLGGTERPKGGVGLNKTIRGHHSGEVWVDSSPIQAKHKVLVPPVESVSRPSTPANIDNVSGNGDHGSRSSGHRQHLTPPEKFTPPELFGAAPRPAFPKLARIPHWRRGRKELVEDVLEELSKGLELDGVLEEMRNLGMRDLELDLHSDRMRRSSEEVDGTLLQYLKPAADGGVGK